MAMLNRINKCLEGCKNGGDVGKLYDEWAQHYNEDCKLFHRPGRKAIYDRIIKFFGDRRDIRMLDVGAGTGSTGVHLKKLGYTNVEAVDPSEESLKVAQANNLYTKTFVQFVGVEPLPIPDNTYDCAIALGVIAPNHLPAVALRDLCRVLKPGALFIMQGTYERWCSLPEYHVTMAAMIEAMVAEKKWIQEEWTIIEDYLDFEGDKKRGLLFAYRKL